MRPCAAMHGTSLLLLMTGIACGHSEDSGRAVPGGVGTAGDTEAGQLQNLPRIDQVAAAKLKVRAF